MPTAARMFFRGILFDNGFTADSPIGTGAALMADVSNQEDTKSVINTVTKETFSEVDIQALAHDKVCLCLDPSVGTAGEYLPCVALKMNLSPVLVQAILEFGKSNSYGQGILYISDISTRSMSSHFIAVFVDRASLLGFLQNIQHLVAKQSQGLVDQIRASITCMPTATPALSRLASEERGNHVAQMIGERGDAAYEQDVGRAGPVQDVPVVGAGAVHGDDRAAPLVEVSRFEFDRQRAEEEVRHEAALPDGDEHMIADPRRGDVLLVRGRNARLLPAASFSDGDSEDRRQASEARVEDRHHGRDALEGLIGSVPDQVLRIGHPPRRR